MKSATAIQLFKSLADEGNVYISLLTHSVFVIIRTEGY